jgi:hypothetical protein
MIDINQFVEIWKRYLGRRLTSAKQHIDNSEYLVEPELIEVVCYWDDSEDVSYLSFEQPDPDLFLLSVSKNSRFGKDEIFVESDAEANAVLLDVLGKQHTFFELYGNKFGYPLAALFGFEDECFVTAIGSEELEGIFNTDCDSSFKIEYSNLYILTMFELRAILQTNVMQLFCRLQV